MKYETIIYEKKEHTGIIRLNRPERMNAVSEEMYSELIELLDKLETEDDLRALVLTGSVRVKDGVEKQAFCAGADLKKHASGERDRKSKREYIYLAHKANLNICTFHKPVIAAVNGAARGAGAEMALDCDFIFMADDASIAFPEIGLGTFVGGGVTKLLPERIGIKKARDLIYTGRVLKGTEAVEYGLADASFPVDELLPRTLEFAELIASRAPVSVSLAKRHLRLSVDRDIETVLEMEAEAILQCMETWDWKEGIDAFNEKRKPLYRGR
ncbi:MAG TPA: enoyl-CoA hydratase/isomerase family protein [Spirochaetota bacterium]|nr:enoyl-CoA hydratase/isomerase family protein [Spirochaetota bacterium]